MKWYNRPISHNSAEKVILKICLVLLIIITWWHFDFPAFHRNPPDIFHPYIEDKGNLSEILAKTDIAITKQKSVHYHSWLDEDFLWRATLSQSDMELSLIHISEPTRPY